MLNFNGCAILMANTRIKVRRETLIDKLETQKKANEKKYEKEKIKYEEDVESFRPKLEKAIADVLKLSNEKLVEKVSSGWGNDSQRLEIKIVVPQKPLSNYNNNRLDKMISVLKAGADEFISVSTQDEYADYL